MCFFFFQAEDGIRDLTVTGVQTCALPTCTPFFLSMSPNAVMEPRPQSVFTARKSAFLTPSFSTYCSRPRASISLGGLMRKTHGLPRFVTDAPLEASTTIGTPYSSSLG